MYISCQLVSTTVHRCWS